jgi:exodeoxyribonuclease VII small subunit
MTERSFRDAYGVLQQHAETLREQAEPNIDDLLTIVTESVAAYQVCKERIDAVEAALKAALDGVGAGASAQAVPAGDQATKAPRAVRKAAPPAESQVSDDDIPF